MSWKRNKGSKISCLKLCTSHHSTQDELGETLQTEKHSFLWTMINFCNSFAKKFDVNLPIQQMQWMCTSCSTWHTGFPDNSSPYQQILHPWSTFNLWVKLTNCSIWRTKCPLVLETPRDDKSTNDIQLVVTKLLALYFKHYAHHDVYYFRWHIPNINSDNWYNPAYLSVVQATRD